MTVFFLASKIVNLVNYLYFNYINFDIIVITWKLLIMTSKTKPFLPLYYNSSKNDLTDSIKNFELDTKGNIKLSSPERVLAKALYEETGSKATIDDIMNVINSLHSKLNDPSNGYKKTIVDLINSRYSGLSKPYKDSYDLADNKHRKLVDQLSAAYNRKIASDVILALTEVRKTL